MAYKLLDAAQERWRRFNGHELVADVLAGVKFKDGIKVTDDDTTTNETRRSPPDVHIAHPQHLTIARAEAGRIIRVALQFRATEGTRGIAQPLRTARRTSSSHDYVCANASRRRPAASE